MRTTLDVDAYLLRRLREEAHREGISFKEMVNRTLQRGLEGGSGARKAPYRCPTFSMGEPLEPIDRALGLSDALSDEDLARKLALRK